MNEFYSFRNEKCPVCKENKLDIIQMPYEIPYFGKCMISVVSCDSCKYRNNDVISLENFGTVKHTIEVAKSEDLNIRVIKSASGKVIIPGIIEMIEHEGYVTNIEGLIVRAMNAIRTANDTHKVKALIDLLIRVIEGKEKLTIIIEDLEGNSGIISENFKASN